MEQTPEESTAWLTITFKDKDGATQAPSTAKYRIDTKGGNEIRGWTDISNPTAEYELTLEPTDNVIKDTTEQMRSNSLGNFQKNIVTVQATFGADDKRNEEYEYEVKDLTQITAST